MTPSELIPQTPTDAPQYGVPPEGFDTWEEYRLYKCRAAYAIVDAVAGLFGALALAPITITVIEGISILITGYVGGVALGSTVFPPAVLVGIVAGAVALGLLEGAAFIYLAQVQQYILAHKDELACTLYNSGSAAQAQAGIAAVTEDAIQSVAWASIFGPLVGGEIASALGGIAGLAVTNNLVNPLFRLIEDFVYPDQDCSGCGGTSGMGWHFDNDEEGWTWTSHENAGDDIYGAWSNVFDPEDPEDSSLGLCWAHIDQLLPIGDVYVDWEYIFAPAGRPTVQLGDGFLCDCYLDVAANAGYSLFIFYDDDTFDTINVPNQTGWNRPGLDGTVGKTVSRLLVMFAVGETTDGRNFALDNIWWGQY